MEVARSKGSQVGGSSVYEGLGFRVVEFKSRGSCDTGGGSLYGVVHPTPLCLRIDTFPS